MKSTKLLRQRLKTAKVALANGRLRMQTACDFVLTQQEVVNRMEDELAILSRGHQEEVEAVEARKVSI